jgi:hypothetical protein
MGGVLYLSDFRSFDHVRDDLGAARGAGIASVAGLLFWTVGIAIWNLIF